MSTWVEMGANSKFLFGYPKNAEYIIFYYFWRDKWWQVMASDGKWCQVMASDGKWGAEWPLAASHAGQVGHQGQHQLLNTSTITTTPLPLILPPLPLLLLLIILRLLLLLLLLLGSTLLCKSWPVLSTSTVHYTPKWYKQHSIHWHHCLYVAFNVHHYTHPK